MVFRSEWNPLQLVRELFESCPGALPPGVESARAGALDSRQWTAEKQGVIEALDRSGLMRAFLDHPDGARNLAQAGLAFGLSWVDAGAAASLLSGSLALAPILRFGTPEQRRDYLEGRPPPHGALCVSEPLPYAGCDTSLLEGRVTIDEWEQGREPVLRVAKRGRFTSHMAFAQVVIAAVAAGDARIRGNCLVILEATDPGVFDRGAEVPKLGHRLASTRNPVFRLRVPAGRIVGGYSIREGVLFPRFAAGSILEPVLRASRVTVSLMTAAKLLSAIDPLIRFGQAKAPAPPAFLDRVAAIWSAGEAAAALGFAAARLCDEIDRATSRPLEAQARVLCPAAKLWNTFEGSRMMREAVSLLGEEGLAEGPWEDLFRKWIDAQVEAVYEGPEAVQRRQIAAGMTDPVFLTQFLDWTGEMRRLAASWPESGAGTVALAMRLWLLTLRELERAANPKLLSDARQGVTFPLADALCHLLASRAQILEVLESAPSRAHTPADLCRLSATRTAGEVVRLCAGLLYGCRRDVAGWFPALRLLVEASLAGTRPALERTRKALTAV